MIVDLSPVCSKVFILMLFSMFANAQEDSLQTKLIDPTKTNDKCSNEQFDSIYLNLQPLKSTTYKDHIRISHVGQIVDFYRSGNESYQGMLTNYTTEYKYVKGKNGEDRKSHQYIFEKINLEQAAVNRMVQQLISTKQPEIPTDKFIPSWQKNFLHCNSIVFEFHLEGKYHHQTFHCPWGQPDTVEFRKVIVENFQSLTSYFRLDSLYKNFEGKLPRGRTYSKDGYRVMYKLTDKQSKAWKKYEPIRDYLKSIKDSVDNYLSIELEKQSTSLNRVQCYGGYHLLLGKNGKLKKIRISASSKPLLRDGLPYYLEDKREIRTCKRVIKKIFKEIDLSSFHLKYPIYRELSIYEGKAHISDNAIY